MTERPILFSGPLVRAILEGRKIQTRRVATHLVYDGEVLPDGSGSAGYEPDCAKGWGRTVTGDRLWVREAWSTGSALDPCSPAEIAQRALDAGYETPWAPLRFAADGATLLESEIRSGGWGGSWGKGRPSIHMPRWASRISLEVTGVHPERLQDISNKDALAEGIANSEMFTAPRFGFRVLWNAINGKRDDGAYAWEVNPWVWAISFRVAEVRRA